MPFVLLTSSIFSPFLMLTTPHCFCVSLYNVILAALCRSCFLTIDLALHTALHIIAPVPKRNSFIRINHHTVIPGIQPIFYLGFSVRQLFRPIFYLNFRVITPFLNPWTPPLSSFNNCDLQNPCV